MAEQELASCNGLDEVGNKCIKIYIPPSQPVIRMTLLCKESMHLASRMTKSAGLSCEAFENAIVCEMQPKGSEMRLRCGGRGCRRSRPKSSQYPPLENESNCPCNSRLSASYSTS